MSVKLEMIRDRLFESGIEQPTNKPQVDDCRQSEYDQSDVEALPDIYVSFVALDCSRHLLEPFLSYTVDMSQ